MTLTKGKTMNTNTRRLIAGVVATVWLMGCAGGWADDITGTIKAGISLTHAGSGTASTLTETLTDPWKWGNTSAIIGTNGSATGLSVLYVANPTIAATGTNSLDLYGVLVDSFGSTVNMLKVKLLLIAPSNSMAGQSVTFRASAANGMTNAIGVAGTTVQCGGAFLLAAPTAAGYTVSNGVCDSVEIVNDSTNAAGCKIIIAGE